MQLKQIVKSQCKWSQKYGAPPRNLSIKVPYYSHTRRKISRWFVPQNRDYQVMPSDLEAWEDKNGKIPDDIILLLFFDWGKRWPDKLTYLGTDTNDTSLLHFPGKLIYTITSFFFFFVLWGCYRYRLQTSAWVDNTLLPSSLYMHYSSSCTTRPFFVLSSNLMLMRQSRGRCALGEMKRGFFLFPLFPSHRPIR